MTTTDRFATWREFAAHLDSIEPGASQHTLMIERLPEGATKFTHVRLGVAGIVESGR